MNVKVTQLVCNPGQMRTTVDLVALETLVLQIATRGFDIDRPLAVVEQADGLFRVVRGHRRWLAALLAEHVKASTETEPLTAGVVHQALIALVMSTQEGIVCGSCGDALTQMTYELREPETDTWQARVMLDPDAPQWILHARNALGATDGIDLTEYMDLCEVEVQLEESNDTRWCPNCGWVTAFTSGEISLLHPEHLLIMHEALGKTYPIEVPAQIVDYKSSLEEQLALIGDNFGAEEADVIGLLQAYRYALLCATPVSVYPQVKDQLRQLADASGQSVQRVKNVLALGELSKEQRTFLVEGSMAVSIAGLLASLDGIKRTAMFNAIQRRAPHCKVSTARDIFERVGCWETLQLELPLIASPAKNNKARTMRALWERAVAKDELAAWQAVADGGNVEVALARIVDVVNVYGYRVDENKLVELIPELGCSTCVLREVLAGVPKLDWYPGYPCQKRKGAKFCGGAVRADEPFVVFVGRDQAGPGATEVDGKPAYTSLELFKRDAAKLKQELIEELSADHGLSPKAVEVVEKFRSQGLGAKRIAEVIQNADFMPDVKLEDITTGVSVLIAQLTEEKAKDSPVQKQRTAIRAFMDAWKYMALANHPLATRCDRCEHFLDESPVKNDPDAPHCAWAKGKKTVEFKAWVEKDGLHRQIPYCRQFSPRMSWAEIIPEYPGPETALTKDWLLHTIELLAGVFKQSCWQKGQHLLEPLTGRPLRSSVNYDMWFLEGLGEHGPKLNKQQLLTLLTWVEAWLSHQDRRMDYQLIPLREGIVLKCKLKYLP